jgi:DNA replicative helicase MCM subunit Mcm2 (Cdc46/Mcm family)
MRILVLNDEGEGTASVRERREIFDVAEFRLSYTCPDCRTEFIFKVENSEPKERWKKCPVCAKELKRWDRDDDSSRGVALWRALSEYRDFHKFAVTEQKLPLKLVIVSPESTDLKPAGGIENA